MPPNRTIVSLLCFLGFLVSVGAQTPDNSPTTSETDTNQPPPENIETNLVAVPPAAVPVASGAQSFPYQFETQNNMPVVAGPTYAGLGEVASPSMGTSSFIGGAAYAAPHGQGIYSAGNLNVHLGLSYSFSYATGLEPQPGEHTSVVSQSISPLLTINLGTHWTLIYSPSLTIFNSGSGLSDVVGQSLSLAGTTVYEGWKFATSESYSFTDTPLVETGAQTSERSEVANVSASHSLGRDFTFVLGANQSMTIANQLNNVYSYGGSGSINYLLSPRVQVGATVGASYNPVSFGPSYTTESYQGDLMVRLGPRTTLSLSGGIEEANFDVNGYPDQVTPIFSASLTYQLGPKTTIGLNASRSFTPTFFSNQVATATSLSASLSRYVTPKLQFSVSGGYYDTSYQSVEPGPVRYNLVGNSSTPLITTSDFEVSREDHGTSVSATLAYAFRTRLSAALSYGWGRNSSSLDAFTYTTSQVGFSLTYQY